MKVRGFQVFKREGEGECWDAVLRVESDGRVYMRSGPGKGARRMVRVYLTTDEIDQLRECDEPLEAIEALVGVIARMTQRN